MRFWRFGIIFSLKKTENEGALPKYSFIQAGLDERNYVRMTYVILATLIIAKLNRYIQETN